MRSWFEAVAAAAVANVAAPAAARNIKSRVMSIDVGQMVKAGVLETSDYRVGLKWKGVLGVVSCHANVNVTLINTEYLMSIDEGQIAEAGVLETRDYGVGLKLNRILIIEGRVMSVNFGKMVKWFEMRKL